MLPTVKVYAETHTHTTHIHKHTHTKAPHTHIHTHEKCIARPLVMPFILLPEASEDVETHTLSYTLVSHTNTHARTPILVTL